MGSSLNGGPFIRVYESAVLYSGPRKEPEFRELPRWSLTMHNAT